MIKKISILALCLSSLFAQMEIGGYARNYIGVLTGGDQEYAIIQNTLDLTFSGGNSKGSFFANPTIYQSPGSAIDFDLSEIYLDLYFSSTDMRIGRQQIIWGKGDGVFITDIVSPKNLSEFLLPDFDEIRTGVIALKLNQYLGDQTFELVYIPIFTATEFADTSSLWSRTPVFPVPVIEDFSHEDVPSTLENSEVFAKFSGILPFMDYEVMGGYMWDDDPSIHVTPQIEMGAVSGVILSPQHHRLSVVGGSFSTELVGMVFRGEGAYYQGKQFLALNAMNFPMDLIEKDYFHYLLGIDFSVGSTRFSSQFIQQAIIDYDDPIVQEATVNTMTFLANRTFLRETLTTQIFGYVGLNKQDALIRPTLSYDLADGFEILGGANIFVNDANLTAGEDPGQFGHFDDNDMIYMKVKYSF
ncbi:MAG: hypothetical protein K9M55_01105 [Candidatus Marinimicrobia bacterium]|nr:hypothetical protein [Candidatus Neomarinimicrobiota bacterium]MCF7921275.1 hypothetical protein [Candidatus Neomarinimicrobiota bacterium]